jgi:hypothetical protein
MALQGVSDRITDIASARKASECLSKEVRDRFLKCVEQEQAELPPVSDRTAGVSRKAQGYP